MNPALILILHKTSELQKEKTGNIIISKNVSGDVPKIGLEPTHLAVPEPKSGVSANFTTWARKYTHYTDYPLSLKCYIGSVVNFAAPFLLSLGMCSRFLA